MTRLLWPAVGIALLLACARHHRAPDDAGLPPQSELAEEVAAAGQAAWDDAKLHVAPETVCLLDELRIVQVADLARLCPGAAACLGWRAVVVPKRNGRRGTERLFVPIAYMPMTYTGRIMSHAALHEWCHAAGHCYLQRWGGWYDADHRDAAVWYDAAHTRIWSAEARGQRVLDGTPEPGEAPEVDEGLESP